MKKIYALFVAMMMSVSMFAQFGILVNGKMYYAGTKNPSPQDASFDEYMVLGLSMKSGDFCQLCDAGSNYATWAVKLDPASNKAFTLADNKYNVSSDGCYDFYIKIQLNNDQLYVGAGNCGTPAGVDITGGQGGNTGGGGDDPVEDEDVNYYAMGWINGADHGETAYDTFEDEYMFQDGKLMIDCKMGSYIAIKDHNGNFYYSRTETTIANSTATMEWANGWSPCQKWAIPEGVNYIIMRSAKYKGELKLERVDKATFDAYHLGTQDIEQTGVKEKARKEIIDGQLRIIRGDKMFDATGRQL